MQMDLGKSFSFSIGGGITPGQFFTFAVVTCGIVLVVGILTYIRINNMKKEFKSEFALLHQKIDSISKTLKDVE